LSGEPYERFFDVGRRGIIRRVVLAIDCIERRAYGREAMNGSEIIGLILSVGLLVYLAIALLKPEWFA
jgi:K+-transporting ATPase KdpF subunit